MKNNTSLTIKDIVTVGIFSVLACILFQLGSMIIFIFGEYAMLAQGTFPSLLAGVVFVVLVKKVNKKGVVLLYSLVFTIIYAIMGFWQMAFVLIPASLLAELILLSEGYLNNKRIKLAFSVQEGIVSMHGMFFFWYLGKEGLMNTFKGMFTQEMVDAMVAPYSNPIVIVSVFVVSFIFAYVGSSIGVSIYNKFFDKTPSKAIIN